MPHPEMGDGGALASGIGASITVQAQDGSEQEIWWGGKRLEDNTSNNEAEYRALIMGLQSLRDQGWEREPTLIMSDSQLVVQQLVQLLVQVLAQLLVQLLGTNELKKLPLQSPRLPL